MIVSILAGLAFLALGGDALVRGAVRLADHLKVSRLPTGLVLVGFGTSTPELATSVDAALSGAPGISVGNVVGSNIANIFLILGLAAAIAPLSCDPRAFRRDGPMMVLATAAVIAVGLTGEVTRWAGAVFVLTLVIYIVLVYRIERRVQDASARMHAAEAVLVREPKLALMDRLMPWSALALALAGIGLIIWGADLMVSGATGLARAFGIGDTIIGLTIVAVGTSLPELATSVVAALRRETDIAFGNILGSNIFNLLGILGVTALVTPIAVPADFHAVDWAILAGATVLLLVFAHTGARLSRAEGAVFIGAYAVFLGLLVHRGIG